MRWIANAVGVPAENLHYRAAELMKEVAPEEHWLAEAEGREQWILESAGLRWTFKRPRADVARNAMFRAIDELADAGLMPPKAQRLIWGMERPYDPTLIRTLSVSKPAECVPLQGLNEWHNPTESWTKIEHISASRMMRLIGDRIVLGEATRLRRPSWEEPEEIVASGPVRREEGQIGSPPPFKTVGVSILVSQYLKLPQDNELKQLVVRVSDVGLDSPSAAWLALNPDCGRVLQWRLVPEGLFRWCNIDRELMVETLWWTDGNVEYPPYVDDEEVGEGWVVLCSKKALGLITEKLGPIERGK